LVCVENHGGAKRLLRVRCTMRFSRFACLLLRACATATAAALILGWPLAAVALVVAGLAGFAAMSRQLIGFARVMHRVVEAVARQARLVAVEPVGMPLPAASRAA
jgi:O-antigen biosynthesis protein